MHKMDLVEKTQKWLLRKMNILLLLISHPVLDPASTYRKFLRHQVGVGEDGRERRVQDEVHAACPEPPQGRLHAVGRQPPVVVGHLPGHKLQVGPEGEDGGGETPADEVGVSDELKERGRPFDVERLLLLAEFRLQKMEPKVESVGMSLNSGIFS